MLDKLTEKELIVFRHCLQEGLSNNQIAVKYQVRRSTIMEHKREICRKLQINRVTEYKGEINV